jgi:hypothetical protein
VVLRKTKGAWEVSTPTWRPAQSRRVEELIRRIAELRGRSVLGPEELRERPQAAVDFGLDPPALSLILVGTAGHTEIHLGLRTVDGLRIFYRIKDVVGIYETDPALADNLPVLPQEWRDKALLTIDPTSKAFDRMRVVGGGAAFTLARSGTNHGWDLVEPRLARADSDRVTGLLRQLEMTQVLGFVAPTSAPPAEVAELQRPRTLLTLSRGSNEVFSLAFGGSLTNSNAILARRSAEEDLLAVPAEAMELLRISYRQMLDSRILRFDARTVREVVFNGREKFSLVQSSNDWRLLPAGLVADSALVTRFLHQLASLDIVDIAKEVVTPLDLPTYGLDPPATRILLRSSVGNTNATLGVLELGAWGDNRIFARVPGEAPVYALNPGQVEELPSASWQLRDRTLWQFNPGLVTSLALSDQGVDWEVRRAGTNEWVASAGWRHQLNPFALEEALYQLSQARAIRWVEEGETRASSFGTAGGKQVRLEFSPQGKAALAPIRIAFGKATLAGNRYAALTFPDGVYLTFEFPGAVFDNLWREIGFTEPAPAGGP